MLHQFVSSVLEGPHVRTTIRMKNSFDYPNMLGISKNFFEVVKHLLAAWGLEDAPVMVSEDGTALSIHGDAILDYSEKAVVVFGFCGTSVKITSFKDLKVMADRRRLASILYVYTVIPMVANAPHFPLFAILHDNTNETFSQDLVLSIWQFLWKVSLINDNI